MLPADRRKRSGFPVDSYYVESKLIEMKPLVSVITIFLNAEKFIQESIGSVFAQTYQNWELLLVDDGSTDMSSEIARRFVEAHPDKVRYLEHDGHKNTGMSASRNLGIRNAIGKYIAFLDADDRWLPEKLERQVALLESQPRAGMVYGATQYWYSWTGLPEDFERDHSPDLGVTQDTLFEPPMLLTCLYPLGKAAAPCPSDLLIRRDVFTRIDGFEESFTGKYQLYEDQAFLAKVYLKEAVFVSSECWDWYRIHPGSCVSVVTESGEYHAVRLFFLKWLENYLSKEMIDDLLIWTSLQNAIEQCHNSPAIEGAYRNSLGSRRDGDIRWLNWWLRVAEGNRANLEFPPDNSDAVRIAIEKAATGMSSDIQLNEPQLTVKANHNYVINFLARADSVRSIFVGFAKAHAPWSNLGLFGEIELTSDWQSFQFEFDATEDEDDARIHFDVGQKDIPVELSSVTLCSLSEGKFIKPGFPSTQVSQSGPHRKLTNSIVQLGKVQFASLRRVTPISREWGFDRGLPIDRYYIEKFLSRHKDEVQGRVLEVGDNSYTRKFGVERVTLSDVLHVKEGNPQASLVGDLTCADHIPSNTFDCIILTQTLQLIYDVRAAIKTVYRILKPGGVLLATFPGISQTYDNEWRDEWCWNFTTVSARRVFEEVFPAANVKIEAFGNVLAAISFLHGLAAEEITQQELDYHEIGYDVTIAVRGVKTEGTHVRLNSIR
jgi:glycosyltransferase involved in cell wall biosynthesis/SAM-dependent methyltransferase